ncbi:MAG TPA: YezD family protein [Opitutaceae bacterium]|nr:YezD family protein [Opitutaceae bacterium]
MSASETAKHQPQPAPEWLAVVRDKVEGLRFGVVQIVVHDSKVTQIERTEKTRLEAPRAH